MPLSAGPRNTPAARSRNRTFPLAAALFFVSGALSLGYELVWIRKAAVVVGASPLALSTVLTAFFLGLGAGSYFVGRFFRSRRWSPLAAFGLFEVAIGVYALAFPELFKVFEVAYGSLYPLTGGSLFPLLVLRFLLLLSLFLAPTFFMGGTLPLLLDGLIAKDASIGPRASFLYGINVLGAGLPAIIAAASRNAASLRSASGRMVLWNALGSGAGSFLTGYALLPACGLRWTILGLGAGSLILAAALQLRAQAQRLVGWFQLAALAAFAALALGRGDIARQTILRHGLGRAVGLGGEASRRDDGRGGRLVEVLEGPLNASFVVEDAQSLRIGSGNVSMALAYKSSPSIRPFPASWPLVCLPSARPRSIFTAFPTRRSFRS
ncbi:MAG: hypothetical protein HY717_02280 [Planctomycetes bacterium]|nr:hypothetical protein [Planctomycetota bacterium]